MGCGSSSPDHVSQTTTSSTNQRGGMITDGSVLPKNQAAANKSAAEASVKKSHEHAVGSMQTATRPKKAPLPQLNNYYRLADKVQPPEDETKLPAQAAIVYQATNAFGVSYVAFAAYVCCSDPDRLHDWRSKLQLPAGQEKEFDKHFINAHFKYHTAQASRPLEEYDLETLLWIKSLYNGAKAKKLQPLPFSLEPLNFWYHLTTVENTIRSISPVWCMLDPKLIFGFLPRADAVDVMRTFDSRVGTFFFRLSNSDPSMVSLVYCLPKSSVVAGIGQEEGKIYRVDQQLFPGFTSIDQFTDWLAMNPHLTHVLPDATGHRASRDEIVSKVTGEVHLNDINTEFNKFRDGFDCLFAGMDTSEETVQGPA
mmetsp:Transcript_35348/g.69336  ORF Transcript_35348/g.69336 Transcript_35348/m.69336 type:complete len:367 (+) Transcript_35348:61-1161(+)